MAFAPENIEAGSFLAIRLCRQSTHLDLYQRVWEGAPLGADDYVICADEKDQYSSRRRKQPTLPLAPNCPTCVEHE
jgi:hypothetical protein